MPTVHFYGTLHPKKLRLNSQKIMGISWGSADFGFPLAMEVKIIDSQFEVTADIPLYEEEMVSLLCARAGDLVRAYTSTVSFAMGLGFIMVWDTFKVDDSTPKDMHAANPILKGICTAYKFPPGTQRDNRQFETVLELVLKEPQLLGSLSDLADTLVFHHTVPTNCGRVLDSLRKAVAPDARPKPGWLILQKLLRVSQPYQEFVSENATDRRHGDRTSEMPDETIMEIARRTWEIVNRFIEFRKRGSTQLPEDEFSELVGQ